VQVLVRRTRQCVPVRSRTQSLSPETAILLHIFVVRATAVVFYLALKQGRSMTSDLQYHRDAEFFAAGICPVCLKQVGKTRPRHAMAQHFYKQKKVDLEHALYATTTYKQHFRHGRSKETLPAEAREIAAVLHRHVDKAILDTILQPDSQKKHQPDTNVQHNRQAQRI
jgi:hypothetical protein